MFSSLVPLIPPIPTSPISTRSWVLLFIVWVTSAGLQAEPARADLAAAEQLLRVADIGAQFESRAQQQAQQIIYNYSVIIHRATDYRLPVVIERRIAECYQEVYQWKKFADGIAHIVANNFSRDELTLLINFHRNLGLPPIQIPLFRATIGKASVIRQQAIEYIFANSEGCVDHDAELIMRHLAAEDVL